MVMPGDTSVEVEVTLPGQDQTGTMETISGGGSDSGMERSVDATAQPVGR